MTVFTVWFTSLHFLLNEIDILNVDVFNGMKNSKEKMTSRHGALHHLYLEQSLCLQLLMLPLFYHHHYLDDLPGPGHAPDHPAGGARQPPRHRQRAQDQEPAQTESLLLRRQPRSSRWGRIHRDMSVE